MEGILKASYKGKLEIGDKELPCAVLEDGTRILSNTAIFMAFNRPRKGKGKEESRVTNMPSFIDANNLKPFIDKAFGDGTDFSIKYGSSGRILQGYKAEILPLLCEVYLSAREEDELTPSQQPLAMAAEILVRNLSKIGIIALIDEATGYQDVREKNELQELLAKYVSAEFLPWTQRFPEEFYKELFRLRGWEYKGKAKSPYVGKVTNWLIYYRLPKGILDELKKLNPILNEDNGYRRHNLHQRLSKEHGVKHLDTHISSIISMMRGCETWGEFEKIFRKSFGILNESTIDHPEVDTAIVSIE